MLGGAFNDRILLQMSETLCLLLCASLLRASSRVSPSRAELLLGAVYGILNSSTLLLKCKLGFVL